MFNTIQSTVLTSLNIQFLVFFPKKKITLFLNIFVDFLKNLVFGILMKHTDSTRCFYFRASNI